MRTHNPKVTVAAALADFDRACQEAFAFAQTKQGLTYVGVEQVGREFRAVYLSSVFRVSIYNEFLVPPWIVLEKNVANKWKRLGLNRAYQRAYGKEVPTPKHIESGSLYDFSSLPQLADILDTNWDRLFAQF